MAARKILGVTIASREQQKRAALFVAAVGLIIAGGTFAAFTGPTIYRQLAWSEAQARIIDVHTRCHFTINRMSRRGPAMVTDYIGCAEARRIAARADHAQGQVKAIDMKNGKVTIHHGPIPSLGWPAMTMTFPANPELLKAVKVGQNVKFTLNCPGNKLQASQPHSPLL